MQRFLRLSIPPWSCISRDFPRKLLSVRSTVWQGGTLSSSTMSEGAGAGAKARDLVKFLELVGNLKHLKRTGWVLRDVEDCETVSAHMYRMAMVTFLLDGSEGLDRLKCMELALVHDLAECTVGDITPYCGVSREEKKRREMEAMVDIEKLISPRGTRMMDLFHEYEESQTPESRFIKDLDRLDMVLQAFEYEKRDNCVGKHKEFVDSVHGRSLHPLVGSLIDEIKAQRAALMGAKKQEDSS
ncbi:5'-deoxynucleotidase HDDC2 [Phlebotomus argentipes]|uniref:5'-deoxynucleotidase HDDC2 n=1 Tax=Phlebotomus argentipes TaxID=94469 RepID=UPI0028932B36|nr:5'-deoxynucleotidase HDDC2 [Phlebotomus argentipes]